MHTSRIFLVSSLLVAVVVIPACSRELPEQAEARLTEFVSARWTQSAERVHPHLTEEGQRKLLEEHPKATEQAPRVKTIDTQIRRHIDIDVKSLSRDGDKITVTAKVKQPEDPSFREKLAMVSFQAESNAEGGKNEKREAAMQAAAHLIKTADIETTTRKDTFELTMQNEQWRIVADVDSMDLGRGFHVRDYGNNPLSNSEKRKFDKPELGPIGDHPVRGTVDGETFELAGGYAEQSGRDNTSYKVRLFGEDVSDCEQPRDLVSIQINLPPGDPDGNADKVGFVGFTIPTPDKKGTVSGFAASNNRVRLEQIRDKTIQGGLAARADSQGHDIDVSGRFNVPIVDCTDRFP